MQLITTCWLSFVAKKLVIPVNHVVTSLLNYYINLSWFCWFFSAVHKIQDWVKRRAEVEKVMALSKAQKAAKAAILSEQELTEKENVQKHLKHLKEEKERQKKLEQVWLPVLHSFLLLIGKTAWRENNDVSKPIRPLWYSVPYPWTPHWWVFVETQNNRFYQPRSGRSSDGVGSCCCCSSS